MCEMHEAQAIRACKGAGLNVVKKTNRSYRASSKWITRIVRSDGTIWYGSDSWRPTGLTIRTKWRGPTALGKEICGAMLMLAWGMGTTGITGGLGEADGD